MGLSDGALFMIKHTTLPNGNQPISSLICPMGVADTLGHGHSDNRCTIILLPIIEIYNNIEKKKYISVLFLYFFKDANF